MGEEKRSFMADSDKGSFCDYLCSKKHLCRKLLWLSLSRNNFVVEEAFVVIFVEGNTFVVDFVKRSVCECLSKETSL